MNLTHEEHRQRHVELHKSLDELIADWIGHTGGLPSQCTLMDFIKWAHQQTLDPIEDPNDGPISER